MLMGFFSFLVLNFDGGREKRDILGFLSLRSQEVTRIIRICITTLQTYNG